MTERRFRVPLSPTQELFVKSDAPIVAIIGPEGEGKTHAGFASILFHRERRAREKKTLHVAIIRDTHENIKNKLRFSIDKVIQKIADDNAMPEFSQSWQWHDGCKILENKDYGVICNLFGANDENDLAKLQGADQWSFIWINDPVPMYRSATAGVSRRVFDAAISRAARGGGAMRVQIDMNPADEDHWTFDALIKNPVMRPDEMPDIYTAVFNIRYGENPARTEKQRQATKAAYKSDAALWKRLVEGKFAFAQIGEAVTPEYKEDYHRSKVRLEAVRGGTGVRFYDGGLNPTCIIGQITPTGRLHIFKTFRGVNIGMTQLLKGAVIPYQKDRCKLIAKWRDIGDPSLGNREQSNSEVSAKAIIEDLMDTSFESGPIAWTIRREALKDAFSYSPAGEPWIQLDPEDVILHQALRGGWHYATGNDGIVMRDGPVKDLHSHPGDAFSYGVAELLPSSLVERIDGVEQYPTEEVETMTGVW